MWYLCPLERAGVIQKLTILERKNGLVLANTRVPVSGTWSILFPFFVNAIEFGLNESANDVVTCVSIKKLTDAVEIPQLPIYGAG